MVTKIGTGSGTVTSNPAGIRCGNNCSQRYNRGQSVTLTATPATDSTFTGWSGACSGVVTTCTVTISTAQNVTATFTRRESVLRLDDVSQAEGRVGRRAFPFTVTLAPASTRRVTVDDATADGTATAGSDYIATTGTLSFWPGQTRKTITVRVRGDQEVEPDETVDLNLSNAVGATLLDGQGIGTILHDD